MTPFALKLRQRAEELGISNAEAARRVGLSERRYAHYVSGKREPDLGTLVRIAEVLGLTPDGLLQADYSNMQHSNDSLMRDRLMLVAKVLSESDLEILLVQAEAIAKHRATSN